MKCSSSCSTNPHDIYPKNLRSQSVLNSFVSARMGDNSFTGRPQWPRAPDPVMYPGMPGNPNMEPRFNMQMRPVNGYIPTSVSTPMSGSYPLWDMDVPSQMFMQAINFDRVMGMGQSAPMVPPGRLSGDLNQTGAITHFYLA